MISTLGQVDLVKIWQTLLAFIPNDLKNFPLQMCKGCGFVLIHTVLHTLEPRIAHIWYWTVKSNQFETCLKPVLWSRAPVFGLLSTHSLWFRVQKPQDLADCVQHLAGAAPNFQMRGSESPYGRCANPHRASTWQILQGLWSHLAKQHPLMCKNPQDLGNHEIRQFPQIRPQIFQFPWA